MPPISSDLATSLPLARLDTSLNATARLRHNTNIADTATGRARFTSPAAVVGANRLEIWCYAQSGDTIELASGAAPNQPHQPQVIVDRAGGIHVAYGVGDQMRYQRSTDGGKTFSQPSDLPLIHSLSLGMRRGPRIAADGNFVCITGI